MLKIYAIGISEIFAVHVYIMCVFWLFFNYVCDLSYGTNIIYVTFLGSIMFVSLIVKNISKKFFKQFLIQLLVIVIGIIVIKTYFIKVVILYLLVGSGVTVFWIRSNWRTFYSIIEMIFGAGIMYIYLFPSTDTNTIIFKDIIPILSGIYIIVRGLDNFEKKHADILNTISRCRNIVYRRHFSMRNYNKD